MKIAMKYCAVIVIRRNQDTLNTDSHNSQLWSLKIVICNVTEFVDTLGGVSSRTDFTRHNHSIAWWWYTSDSICNREVR